MGKKIGRAAAGGCAACGPKVVLDERQPSHSASISPVAKRTNRRRQSKATAFYRALTAEFERRRGDLCIPMGGQSLSGRKSVEDLSGIESGYYAKILAPDTPSGRRAGWEVIDEIVQALWGKDFRLRIDPSENMLSALSTGQAVNERYRNIRHWRHRKFFADIGRLGGKAYFANTTSKKRRAIARKAAKARWRKHRARLAETQS
jgi:hypothetical protein